MFRLFASVAVLLGAFAIFDHVEVLKATISLAGVNLSLAFLAAVACSYLSFSRMGKR